MNNHVIKPNRTSAIGFLLAAGGASVMPATPSSAQCFVAEKMPHIGYVNNDPGESSFTLGTTFALVEFNGHLLSAEGGSAGGLYRFNGEWWEQLFDTDKGAFLVYEDELYAFGGPIRRTVDGNIYEWETIATASSLILTAVEWNGDLVIGGHFTFVDGVPMNGIARWDGEQWHPFGPGFDHWVGALAVFNGELIAGGGFKYAGDTLVNRVARWDGEAWQPMSLGLGDVDAPYPANWFQGGSSVRALQEYNGSLVASGPFKNAGEMSANGLARWDGYAWQPMELPDSMSMVLGVYRLAVVGEDLYIGSATPSSAPPKFGPLFRWSDHPDRYGISPVPVFSGSIGQVKVILPLESGGIMIDSGQTFSTFQLESAPGSSHRAVVYDLTPKITHHPQNATVDAGSHAAFQVEVDLAGSAGAWYTWLRDGVPLNQIHNGNAFGANTPTLVLTNITENDLGTYSVLVDTPCGKVLESKPAMLAVIPPPDPEGCPADLTGDGKVDVYDLIKLLSNFGPCKF